MKTIALWLVAILSSTVSAVQLPRTREDPYVTHVVSRDDDHRARQGQDPSFQFGLCDPLSNIIVINRADAKGRVRREHAIHEFQRDGHIDIKRVKFWDPVHKESLDGDALDKQAAAMRNMVSAKSHHEQAPLDDGAYALAQTHKDIYRYVVTNGIPCALIFEDDFSLTNTFTDRVRQVVDAAPEGFDYIKLAWCNTNLIGKDKPAYDTRPKLVLGKGGGCTDGYIVSREGANFLHAANEPLWMSSDGILDDFWLKYTQVYKARGRPVLGYHVEPALSWQGADYISEGGKLFDAGGNASVKL